MARADRRRGASPKPAAGAQSRRDVKQANFEDTLFFTRLRKHAKWMFVFLALVFAGGFVIFGVGANNGGTGIGDILSSGNGGSNGVASASDARKRLAKNPKDATAQRDLATALETDGRNDEAIVALTAYTKLRPKDQDALRELAGLYLTRGNSFQADAQNAQIRAGYLTSGSTFSDPLKLGKDGVTLGQDPITTAVSTLANETINAAITKSQDAYGQAVTTYEKLVKVAPSDPQVQLELAQTAEQVRNYPKAIAAYQRFLVLAPDDTSAEIVKAQIKQLQAALQPAASG